MTSPSSVAAMPSPPGEQEEKEEETKERRRRRRREEKALRKKKKEKKKRQTKTKTEKRKRKQPPDRGGVQEAHQQQQEDAVLAAAASAAPPSRRSKKRRQQQLQGKPHDETAAADGGGTIDPGASSLRQQPQSPAAKQEEEEEEEAPDESRDKDRSPPPSPSSDTQEEEQPRKQPPQQEPQTQPQQPAAVQEEERPLVESSGLPPGVAPDPSASYATLLLFYQYVEPPWSDAAYRQVLRDCDRIARAHCVTGRMRVAREGLNCTLTAASSQQARDFCAALRRQWPAQLRATEFKLTHHLPAAQRFRQLKIVPVRELVHYGLDGGGAQQAPPIQQYGGVHLEPADYHRQLADPDTVVIDVRNHYEANIGRFVPPPCDGGGGDNNNNGGTDGGDGGDRFLDPHMRRSTEFPAWLDDPATRAKLRGRSVAMYCTGGIRCERASALLRYKMATDPDMKQLNIRNVYQLQGGIDKYFKEFPDGGYWRGVNYVFDKRFAHAPVEQTETTGKLNKPQHPSSENEGEPPAPPPSQQPPPKEHDDNNNNHEDDSSDAKQPAAAAPPPAPLGRCEACGRPWDRYRGKRRCPTCGVPSLVCRDCWRAHETGARLLDRTVRCDLCVRQNVTSKRELRERERRQQREARERRQRERPGPQQQQQQQQQPGAAHPNPKGVTRLYLKNMCRHRMTEQVLVEHLSPAGKVTHIVWNCRQGQFLGQGWVEMATPEAAAAAVLKSGQRVLGRPLYIEYQPPDGKDLWPPPRGAV